MLKHSLLLSVLILGGIPLLAQDQQKTPEQYWADTGLTLSNIGQMLSKECYASAKDLVACTQGVNVLAGSVTPSEVFATPEEAEKSKTTIGALKKKYGAFNLYERTKVDESKSSASEVWNHYKQSRDLQVSAVTAVYSSKATKVDFAAIIQDLKPQVITGTLANDEALIASDVMNTVLASAVDPHTHIDPEAQVKDEEKGVDPSYAGVGAVIAPVGSKVVVMDLMRGGPAITAGMKVHDIFTSVDGQTAEGKDSTAISKLLRGTAGTAVKVSVIRDGVPVDFMITRAKIVSKNVNTDTLTDTNETIGYIKLNNFEDGQACDKVAAAIKDFETGKAKGLILDLRNNGGGFLDQAQCIGSLFVGKKLIVKAKYLQPDDDKTAPKEKDYIGTRDQATTLPLVTLINAGSASASEILAGALQDYDRSWLAGDRSYGKATVQAGFDWGPGILIFQTDQRFYQPFGRTNQIVGIKPSFYIDPKPGATADDKFALREADLYTNALPPLSPEWQEPHPQQVAKIQACVDASGIPGKVYEAKKNDAIPGDYQVFTAETILSCAASVAAGNAQ